MKVGDLVRFTKTGAVALVLDLAGEGEDYAAFHLQVISGEWADGEPTTTPLTWMTEDMLQRTAEVISESR